ncbi:Na/Pi symporter [Candidatus Fermentibacterales bacterium]|nr:Na/Pi symporter [Candidatus Fermentibacterales bacterium]
MSRKDIALKLLFFAVLIYLFLVSIRLMGDAFKLFGAGFAETLIAQTTNPFKGLLVGVIATSIVQSSSCTTSIVVGFVASGSLTIGNAIPIIMGANIGTTVTNTLVSLGHVHRRDEFEWAFAGAMVHDFFNIFAVLFIMPLQLKFGLLEKIAGWLTSAFVGIGGIEVINPIKVTTGPAVCLFELVCAEAPLAMLAVALVLLFTSLRIITRLMRGLVKTQAERRINEYVFNNPVRAFLAGASLTAVVQSSSITTSLAVPLIGARIVTVEKAFPYTLGTNIGTTVTAILASMATANPLAITIALTHLVFNIIGISILYPLRFLPIGLAKELGRRAARNRVYAILYIIVTFYVLPLGLMFLWR